MYIDTYFAGSWNSKEASHNKGTARSRHSYIISYKGCQIVWESQLWTEVCLSSTESKYTWLSYSLCESIPMMPLLNEIKK